MSQPPPPFIIYALPRSRTFWLSKFLSYGGWHCGHDEVRHVRSLDDVKTWFRMSMTGTAETGSASFWRLVQKIRPDVRVAVIRRERGAVMESLFRTGIPFDQAELSKILLGQDRKLDQIEQRVPGALSLQYENLSEEKACARLFEYCLPYQFDADWWKKVSVINLQTDLRTDMRYFQSYQPQLTRVAQQAKQAMLSNFARRPVASEAITFQQEPFNIFIHDGKKLFEEHLVQVGEEPEAYSGKNLALMERLASAGILYVTTARCNGRMLGYLMSIITPSLDNEYTQEALHTTFFTSKDAPGLGIKLQRASIEFLRGKGVDIVSFRAGHRGNGPRLSGLYRRLGAENFGQLFALDLKGAA